MSVLQRFQPAGRGWLPCCGIPNLNPRSPAEMGRSLGLILSICTSVHYIITFLVLLFLRNTVLYRERGTNTQYSNKVTVALLRRRFGCLLLVFLLFSLSFIRYIKSTEGVVEAFRKLRTSGTVARGGTPPAGRPSTTIFLGTACQSIPQCPTIPRETNGLKQQQLQTAWILFFLVFLLLLFEKIICIPAPAKHPSHLGDFFVFCLLITAEDTCCQPSPPPELCTAYRKVFCLC